MDSGKVRRIFGIGLAVAYVFVSISGCSKKNEKAGNGQGGLEYPSGLTYQDAVAPYSADIANETPSPLSYRVYRVQKGDMIGPLSEAFGLTQDSLISVNNIKQTRLLQVGQYLKIPSVSGILHTVKADGETAFAIAEKYNVSPEKCAAVNNLSLIDPLKAGTAVFVPDAELDWFTRQEINGDLFVQPLRGQLAYYSSHFGWRKSPFTGARSYHGGVDMVARGGTGTPIYPAMSGQVVAAGWSDVYGNYVKVQHHSGYATLYGHMDRIHASYGQWVSTGTMIGRVGNTGQSTGPHLHFTVYRNGKEVNPLGLLK